MFIPGNESQPNPPPVTDETGPVAMPSDSQPPPTKASLKTWWNHFKFTQRMKEAESHKGMSQLIGGCYTAVVVGYTKDDERAGEVVHSVFGKPLRESLKYASVQISTANANGELYVWGYIPVVVAKCGLYLKECATEVKGTFRVNGSNKRMGDLQAEFERAPRYGKSLDWKRENYTTHDVASVFRRYLTKMPEPVIPYDMYHEFRDALSKQPYNEDEVISTYKRLIAALPHANQYLLLYVLDLLSVFARKSDKNLMTASNLAVIFRPGIISHPDHEMSPKEHDLSQRVLEFLIAQQDWFMLDIPPPPRPVEVRTASPTSVDEDILMHPSSDEGEESPDSGGWKLVGKEPKRIRRRRTLEELDETRTASRDLSPVTESSGQAESPGVSRSHTLPSVKGSTRDTPSDDKQQRARVLRKQKRASSSQPRKVGSLDSS